MHRFELARRNCKRMFLQITCCDEQARNTTFRRTFWYLRGTRSVQYAHTIVSLVSSHRQSYGHANARCESMHHLLNVKLPLRALTCEVPSQPMPRPLTRVRQTETLACDCRGGVCDGHLRLPEASSIATARATIAATHHRRAARCRAVCQLCHQTLKMSH